MRRTITVLLMIGFMIVHKLMPRAEEKQHKDKQAGDRKQSLCQNIQVYQHINLLLIHLKNQLVKVSDYLIIVKLYSKA